MRRRRVVAAMTLALLSAAPSPGAADPSEPAVEERGPVSSRDDAYERGVRARVLKDWVAALDAFRRVIAVRADFADAWNELGFALRNLGRYPESLEAYGEALRLRPDFPEALEYLGEAYVKLGRLEDARRMLERLRGLDTRRAQELEEEIEKGK